MSNYKKEVEEKWGETKEYQEYAEKSKNFTVDKFESAKEMFLLLAAKFSTCLILGQNPSDEEPQKLVEKLQDYITENFYNCNNFMLKNLASMYVLDPRFKVFFDQFEEGTAEFIQEAINIYCE